MKNLKYINFRFVLLLSLMIGIFSSCDREFSDDVEFATFTTKWDIFTYATEGINDQNIYSFDHAT